MNSHPSILQLKTEWTISIQDIYKYRRISAILLGLVARHSSTVIEVQDWIANKNFDCMNNEIDAYLRNHIRVSSLHRIILRTHENPFMSSNEAASPELSLFATISNHYHQRGLNMIYLADILTSPRGNPPFLDIIRRLLRSRRVKRSINRVYSLRLFSLTWSPEIIFDYKASTMAFNHGLQAKFLLLSLTCFKRK